MRSRSAMPALVRSGLVLTLVAGVVSAAQLAVAPQVGRARADVTTGSAGVFVPTQGTVLDTRSGLGGVSGPVAVNAWYAVPVAGQAGVPSSGVSAVQVSVTVLTPAVTGLVKLAPDGTTDVHIAALTYTGGGGSISASSIVALPADGKIGVLATTSVTVLMHVQGYYTAGDGSPAPGGYVPVGPTRIVDTRYGTGLPQAKLATGSTTTIPVGGLAGAPSDASAVFVMLTAITTSSSSGYFSPYPAGSTRPANVSLNYLPASSTIAGAAVDLGTGGQFNLWIGTVGTAIDVIVDVVGYYTATPGSGAAFTPAAARVYDSRVAPEVALPPGESRTVPAGGTADVPLLAAGTSAYAISAQIVHSGSSAGYLTTAPGDQSAATVSAVFFSAGNDVRSDLVIVPAANDGTVTLTNVSSDSIDVVLDVEGWFSAPTPTMPTVTSSSFTDGETGAPADANATFSFSAPPAPGQTAAVRFRYTLDDAAPTLVEGSSPTVPLGVTADGPHYLLVSAIDANGGESDFTDFFFDVGDPPPASAEVDNDTVQESVSSQVSTTDSDGTTVTQSSTESHNLTAAAPQQLPGGGGGPPIARLSCKVSNHRELFLDATLDMRYQCASHRANFGIQLTPPPAGATSVSYVFESGFQWYRNGRRETDTAWHDEPIWYHFHGTFNPVYNQSYVFGSDQLHYSFWRGRVLYMVQVTVRVQFIAVP